MAVKSFLLRAPYASRITTQLDGSALLQFAAGKEEEIIAWLDTLGQQARDEFNNNLIERKEQQAAITIQQSVPPNLAANIQHQNIKQQNLTQNLLPNLNSNSTPTPNPDTHD